MSVVGGAARSVGKTVNRAADATTAAAGAVGGAAVNGIVGGVTGAAEGIKRGVSSGSHSTPAAALAMGALGVAGLVEWPVVLMGSFEKEFLSIPGEVIRATIRNNQKCFVVSDPKTGKLANKFILASPALAGRVTDAQIVREERKGKAPSDHAPVLIDVSPI